MLMLKFKLSLIWAIKLLNIFINVQFHLIGSKFGIIKVRCFATCNGDHKYS